MNLQGELKALKERIAEIEEQVKKEQTFPEYGDDYWFLLSGGTINDNFYTNSHVDNKRLEIGNFFKTKEQAQFTVEKLKVEAELRKYSRPFERGSLNFIMCFDTEEDKIYSETRRFMNQGALYFDWGQVAQAIQAVGEERIKKYIFGVED